MPLSNEDLWYCKQNGYYRLPNLLPDNLIDRLNEATDCEILSMCEPIVWEDTDARNDSSYLRDCPEITYPKM